MNPLRLWNSRSATRFSLIVWQSLAAGVLWQAGAGLSHGSLIFSHTEVSETAKPSQTETVARFPFQNLGKQTIKVLEVKTDCGCCTSAMLQKKEYAPGERGEIVLTFKYGAMTGLQRKGAVVATDDPRQSLVPLSVIATIPAVIKLSANVLLWEESERADAKSLIVKTSETTPVKELRATTDSPLLAVAVERVTPTEYRVQVTPQANRRDISATLQCEAVLEGAERKLLNAFIRVR